MLTYGPTPTIDSDHIHLGAQGGLCGWGLGGLGGEGVLRELWSLKNLGYVG